MRKSISTHTLTWSVTDKYGKKGLLREISTHTLTWSVTLDVVYIWCLLNVMRTYFFLFNGYRFDFVHCAFTNSMAFSCELTRDLWFTWGTLVKILGRLQGHRSLWCRSVLLYASNCCLSNISADYHALGLLFSEVYL